MCFLALGRRLFQCQTFLKEWTLTGVSICEALAVMTDLWLISVPLDKTSLTSVEKLKHTIAKTGLASCCKFSIPDLKVGEVLSVPLRRSRVEYEELMYAYRSKRRGVTLCCLQWAMRVYVSSVFILYSWVSLRRVMVFGVLLWWRDKRLRLLSTVWGNISIWPISLNVINVTQTAKEPHSFLILSRF